MKQWMSYAFAGVVMALAQHPAAAGTPDWCKNVPSNLSADPSALSSKDPIDVVKAFVGVECKPDAEVEANRAQIEQARAAWSKRLGMTEADWADAVGWAGMMPYDQVEVRGDLTAKDVTKYSPIDQYLLIAQKTGKYGAHPAGELYATDLFEPHLSEVGRFAMIETCVRSDNAVWSAMCQPDLDAFDAHKFFDEVRADTQHDPGARMALRIKAFGLPDAIKAHAEVVAKLRKSDDAYEKMFGIAARARGDWAKSVGSNAKLLALVNQMESATFEESRKMFDNCDDATYAALAEAASKLSAKSVENLKDDRYDPFGGFTKKALPILLQDPEFNIAAIAVTMCGERGGLATALAKYLDDLPGGRGPRQLAINAIREAKLQPDRMDEKITIPSLGLRPYLESKRIRGGGSGGSAGGQVKSIKKKGDYLEIELAPMLTVQDDCLKEHVTHRIDHVEDNGNVIYQRQCDKMGKVTHNDQWSNMKVSTRYEKVLKPGVVISITSGTDGKDTDLVAMWASPKATKPMWMFGANVK